MYSASFTWITLLAFYLDDTCLDISFLQIEARNEFLFRMLHDKHINMY